MKEDGDRYLREVLSVSLPEPRPTARNTDAGRWIETVRTEEHGELLHMVQELKIGGTRTPGR